MESILAHLRNHPHSYHVPGHKMGRGLPGEIGQWLGVSGRLDLTEIPGLDDLHTPEGAIRDAQQLAADAFGAEETYFLINGSTAGNLAMIMAAIKPHESILVPRNLHKSVLNGLVLAQATPVFYTPEVDETFGIATGVSVETVRRMVQAHPQARALLITSPTYHGICSDLATIAEVVHAAGMLLLVDEAHGAHFAFHERLPQTAMAAGADMAVQSTHKMLGSLTQSSMLHVQGPRVDRVRLRKRLQLVQSTSPSYLLLLSLDCARHQMVTEGRARLEQALDAVEAGAEALQQLPHLRLLTERDLGGEFRLDPLKWTVDVTDLGQTGGAVYQRLHERGYTLELSDPQNVVAIFTYADERRQVERLVQAFAGLEATEGTEAVADPLPTNLFAKGEVGRAPAELERLVPLHEAYEQEAEAVLLPEAAGRAAAEMVIPYPPGIPLIVPGEVWTEDLIAHVSRLLAAGVRFQGAEDAALRVVQVLKK
ncbi:MAG TPA: aminotransferase class I/II-fold pyridoxal phosphate-dependent enzyme [Bacilli bacterium]|nr:aminotransferase class I/II-fold pyridoxal phosphate-dependent enzyme [Bacilli bacterium]